jgi:hypothetical protein
LSKIGNIENPSTRSAKTPFWKCGEAETDDELIAKVSDTTPIIFDTNYFENSLAGQIS